MLTDALSSTVDGLARELVEVRRDLHAHPELARTETRTTTLVARHLEAAGIRVRPLPGTGLVADLGPRDAAYRVALRADLDALPVLDRTGLPWASVYDGICHACGHDVHTSALLGAGLALRAHEDAWCDLGVAVRLDLPAGRGGHPRRRARGRRPRWPRRRRPDLRHPLRPGRRRGARRPGRGSHHRRRRLGHRHPVRARWPHLRPHLTEDLTYALAKVVTDVPAALSRRLDPRAGAALVWGSLHAGGAQNVIPSTGTVSGTLRMLDADAWASMGHLVEDLVEAVVAPYGVSAKVEHVRGVPPVVNDHVSVEVVSGAARAVLGPDAVESTRQSLGGEDFAWYLTTVPGAMVRLGTRTPGGRTYDLHQGDLTVDENAICAGAKLLAASALGCSSLAGPIGA